MESITLITKLNLKLKSNLCNYNDACILAKGTITVASVPPPAVNPNKNDKEVVFKNCSQFTDSINEINNTEIDDTKDIDIVIPMYNSIGYSDNYSKTSRS